MGSRGRLELPTWSPGLDRGPRIHQVVAQLSGVRLDNATLTLIQGVLAQPVAPAPATIDAMRVEKRKRDLALAHAAGTIDDDAYLARMAELRKVQPRRVEDATVDSAAAIELLRNVARVWEAAATDEARSELLHAIYERIVVSLRTDSRQPRPGRRGSSHAARVPARIRTRSARIGRGE